MSTLVLNERTGAVVTERGVRASGIGARIRGLIGRTGMGSDEALLLKAKRIHTFGMRFAIDVAFCDREGSVVAVYRGLGPRRITQRARGAHTAIEMPAGSMGAVLDGDALLIRDL